MPTPLLMIVFTLLQPARANDPSLVLRTAIADRLHVTPADVEVTGLEAMATVLPATLDWTVDLPAVGAVWGNVPVVFRAATAAGPRREVARPHIAVWLSLPVAASAVMAGQRVTVALARVACDQLRGEDPVDPAGSWQARTDIRAGAPLTSARVRPMPDAVAGATVRIRAGRDGLAVVAPGQLADDAFIGAQVHVVNLVTHAQLTGTYDANGDVRVGEF